jgi:hypothetical protein
MNDTPELRLQILAMAAGTSGEIIGNATAMLAFVLGSTAEAPGEPDTKPTRSRKAKEEPAATTADAPSDTPQPSTESPSSADTTANTESETASASLDDDDDGVVKDRAATKALAMKLTQTKGQDGNVAMSAIFQEHGATKNERGAFSFGSIDDAKMPSVYDALAAALAA